MRQIASGGPEVMLPMLWDSSLRTCTEATRAAMSLHSRADVVRLALQTIPDLVFDSISSASVDEELLRQLAGGANAGEDMPTTPNNFVAFERVKLLDEYSPNSATQIALTRVGEKELSKARNAAKLCVLEIGDFAYRATVLLTKLERESPDFLARIKATYAEEDLNSRKVFGLTDIQPWGEEDYHDYGLPDED